jgi:hypothetical protein
VPGQRELPQIRGRKVRMHVSPSRCVQAASATRYFSAATRGNRRMPCREPNGKLLVIRASGRPEMTQGSSPTEAAT